jgi:hypothetical protein
MKVTALWPMALERRVSQDDCAKSLYSNKYFLLGDYSKDSYGTLLHYSVTRHQAYIQQSKRLGNSFKGIVQRDLTMVETRLKQSVL